MSGGVDFGGGDGTTKPPSLVAAGDQGLRVCGDEVLSVSELWFWLLLLLLLLLLPSSSPSDGDGMRWDGI